MPLAIQFRMRMKYCVSCGAAFEAVTAWHKFCTEACGQRHKRKAKNLPIRGEGRYCRQCGVCFCPLYRQGGNQQHCSADCSKRSARESRSRFYERNPQKDAEYRERRKAKRLPEGNMIRYRVRYPDAPTACQACGETRVLDIAHRPEHRRNGSWRSRKNSTPEKVWILCPTCHALIDRMGYDPATLGLS